MRFPSAESPHDTVELQIRREMIHEGQDDIAVEQESFTFPRVGHIGKLMGRNVQLLRQNLAVTGSLVQHIHEV